MSVTNLTDTYWRWNNDPTVWGFDSADLLFESNGVSCNYVSITESYDISDLPHTMEYFTADDSFYAWDSSHGWYDEAYREIHITGGDDVEDTAFIELLENSATQFVPPVPYMTTSTELTSIADAIRTKGGTSAPLVYPTGFVSAIEAIPSGGSSSYTVTIILADPISPSDFQNCIIYDGQGGTQIGTISSPTGRATVTTATGMIVVQFFGSYVETPACSNVDGVLCDNTIGLIYGGDHDIGLAVIGDGEVTIRKVDYDA